MGAHAGVGAVEAGGVVEAWGGAQGVAGGGSSAACWLRWWVEHGRLEASDVGLEGDFSPQEAHLLDDLCKHCKHCKHCR